MLKSLIAAAIATAALVAGAPVEETVAKRAPAGVPGFDISHYQPNVDFASEYSKGARWVYIKATEGTTYTDSSFSSHYTGATNAGLLRGAYHFARPDVSSGATQANYFISNGGGWSGDGRTLPGALDIEYNPYGATCYGLSKSAMTSWIKDFSDTYHAKTGRCPTIYTTTDWWTTCTGSSAFGSTNALWIARYSSSYSSDQSPFPGNQDVWNGSLAGLKSYATS
ncbi:unnamed protein product [Tilletia controversa]|nr:unnamed protein product [Tilletia controversa]CAD6951421.1 unnamed protein product [Tilletia controversa]CAD6969670.1 unnamed protein product [Tilletia controversa]CAD6973402.1 unnamed protein product [Tilletia controversa]